MFTGIIEEVGKIQKFFGTRGLKALEVQAGTICDNLKIGDSVAVNGACLTLTGKKRGSLIFDVMGETLVKTSLKNLKRGDKVNLERSLEASASLSGHFVYGHIDGIRPLAFVKKTADESFLDITISDDDHKYIVEKGSIAIDGISLTIGKVFSDKIRIFLIPHTLKNTTLLNKKRGDRVNIEFDILAKYIYKQSKKRGITQEFLEKQGFC